MNNLLYGSGVACCLSLSWYHPFSGACFAISEGCRYSYNIYKNNKIKNLVRSFLDKGDQWMPEDPCKMDTKDKCYVLPACAFSCIGVWDLQSSLITRVVVATTLLALNGYRLFPSVNNALKTSKEKQEWLEYVESEKTAEQAWVSIYQKLDNFIRQLPEVDSAIGDWDEVVNGVYTAEAISPNGEKFYVTVENMAITENFKEWQVYMHAQSVLGQVFLKKPSEKISSLQGLGLAYFGFIHSNPCYMAYASVNRPEMKKFHDLNVECYVLMQKVIQDCLDDLPKATHELKNLVGKEVIMSVGVSMLEIELGKQAYANRGIMKNPYFIEEKTTMRGISHLLHGAVAKFMMINNKNRKYFRVAPMPKQAELLANKLKELNLSKGYQNHKAGYKYSGKWIKGAGMGDFPITMRVEVAAFLTKKNIE